MQRIDFIGLQVANLAQAIDLYSSKYQFQRLASTSLKCSSMLMQHGAIKLKLTALNQDETMTPLTQEVVEIVFYGDDFDRIKKKKKAQGAREVLAQITYESFVFLLFYRCEKHHPHK